MVDRLVHLGNVISNNIDGGQLDMKQKAARYVDKNCSINQEFSFAHPASRILLNKIYNCHFSGCQIWNLFSQGAERFYSTYNRSVKVMADLPLATHRYLIEPVSGQPHMSIILIRNFLNFISSIKNSNKLVLKQLYEITKSDVRTITGSNLRNILIQTNLLNIDELQPSVVQQVTYKEMQDRDRWRLPYLGKLLEQRGEVFYQCGDCTELTELINSICVT